MKKDQCNSSACEIKEYLSENPKQAKKIFSDLGIAMRQISKGIAIGMAIGAILSSLYFAHEIIIKLESFYEITTKPENPYEQ